MWVGNVFAWRGSPAAWNEALELVVRARPEEPSAEEQKRLHRLGEGLVVATLSTADGMDLRVATAGSHAKDLLGPHATAPGLA